MSISLSFSKNDLALSLMTHQQDANILSHFLLSLRQESYRRANLCKAGFNFSVPTPHPPWEIWEQGLRRYCFLWLRIIEEKLRQGSRKY